MKKMLLLSGIAGLFSLSAQAQYYQPQYYQPQYARPQATNANGYTSQTPQKRTTSAPSHSVRPVIGLDYTYANLNFDDDENDTYLNNTSHTLSPVLGLRFNQYVGLEAFYQKSKEMKKSSTVVLSNNHISDCDTKVSYQNYGADLVGYLPIDTHINMLGTLGISYYDAKLKVSFSGYGSASDSDQHIAGRIGVGFESDVTDHLSIRILGRYNYIGMDGLDSIVDFSAGVRYYF